MISQVYKFAKIEYVTAKFSNSLRRPCSVKFNERYLHVKGQCHEEFAVLGQFWAKIITSRLYS